jgi:hypothetical protein
MVAQIPNSAAAWFHRAQQALVHAMMAGPTHRPKRSAQEVVAVSAHPLAIEAALQWSFG